MNLTVQMRGLDTLSLKVKYMIRPVQAALRDGVEEAAGIFEAAAKEKSPVLSGANRDSISTEVTTDEPEKQVRSIAPHMPYSARLEFGFIGADSLGRVYNQAAQPYMRPAFDENKEAARDAIKDAVLNAAQEAGMRSAAKRAA